MSESTNEEVAVAPPSEDRDGHHPWATSEVPRAVKEEDTAIASQPARVNEQLNSNHSLETQPVADAAEAVAVLVAGAAAGQTGTNVVNKNARVRVIRRTPKGELPLPLQAALALSVPTSFVVALLQFLLSV